MNTDTLKELEAWYIKFREGRGLDWVRFEAILSRAKQEESQNPTVKEWRFKGKEVTMGVFLEAICEWKHRWEISDPARRELNALLNSFIDMKPTAPASLVEDIKKYAQEKGESGEMTQECAGGLFEILSAYRPEKPTADKGQELKLKAAEILADYTIKHTNMDEDLACALGVAIGELSRYTPTEPRPQERGLREEIEQAIKDESEDGTYAVEFIGKLEDIMSRHASPVKEEPRPQEESELLAMGKRKYASLGAYTCAIHHKSGVKLVHGFDIADLKKSIRAYLNTLPDHDGKEK